MYNLNYRFDSLSPAGKCSGTALDLIKRYNELAKEAHSSGNYVEMEVFRQYAEHYRKIVTEINERKTTSQGQQSWTPQQDAPQQQPEEADAAEVKENLTTDEAITQTPLSYKKKTLKIVEVKESEVLPEDEKKEKKKRVCRKKTKPEGQIESEAV